LNAPEVAPFSQGQGDGNPVIAPDGKRFYFTSMRSLDGGPKTPLTYGAMKDYFAGPQNGLRDIFWIEGAVVHRLRPQGK